MLKMYSYGVYFNIMLKFASNYQCISKLMPINYKEGMDNIRQRNIKIVKF